MSSTWRQTHTRAADNSWIRNHNAQEFSHSSPELYGGASTPAAPARKKSVIATLMLPLAMAASTRKSFTSAAATTSPSPASSSRGGGRKESPEMKMARTGDAPSPLAASAAAFLATARGSSTKEQVAASRIQRAFREYQGQRMARIRRSAASSQAPLVLVTSSVERQAMPTYSVRKQSPISLSTGFSFTRGSGSGEAEDYEFA